MSNPSKPGAVTVASLLRPAAMNLNLQSTTKVAALREVAGLLQSSNCISNFDAFFQEFGVAREPVLPPEIHRDLRDRRVIGAFAFGVHPASVADVRDERAVAVEEPARVFAGRR
jgi:hypothetical protein